MKLIVNSVTKKTIWLPLLLLSITVLEIREQKLKSEIQIRNFVPAKPEKSKIREIELPQKFSLHTVNCEQVCFSNSCRLSAFVSRFQQSRIRELRKFFGQESHRPLPPSLKVAVRL